MFAGYKTYAAAILLLVVAVAEGPLGISIPGVHVADNWLLLVIEALGLTGIRAAIAKQVIKGLTR